MSESLAQAQRQMDDDDDIEPFPGPPHTYTTNFHGGDGEGWRKRNILSLDGGGIRGYWSLLALEKLMEDIAFEEERLDDEALHSFDPLEWPKDVTQAPLTEKEKRNLKDSDCPEDEVLNVPRTRRYLPCHYFDQIGGSSTGALIAIMLGRLRMTVPDCIAEYKTLGQEVFGKPRMVFTLRYGVGDRFKYNAANLEKVFRSVAERRSERMGKNPSGRITLPSGRGLCTTFVTTMKTEEDTRSSSLYLIRSYNHEVTNSPDQSRGPTPGTTMSQSRVNTDQSRTNTGFSAKNHATRRRVRKKRGLRDINYEEAQDFEIWQVARAATAAIFYFAPLDIGYGGAGSRITFTDGGFSHTNNPTQEAIREIEELYGDDSISTVVSVGTARGRLESSVKKPFFSRIPKSTREFADTATNPEIVHKNVDQDRKRDYSYYRFNDPGGLKIDLDEWKPKQGMFSKEGGVQTMKEIRRAFAEWAIEPETVEQLRQCATELVRCRRERSVTARWERYATGCQFKCNLRGCPKAEEEFHDRNLFKDHLRREHSKAEHELEKECNDRRKRWRYRSPP